MRDKWVGNHGRIETLLSGSYHNEALALEGENIYEDTKETISFAVQIVRFI